MYLEKKSPPLNALYSLLVLLFLNLIRENGDKNTKTKNENDYHRKNF